MGAIRKTSKNDCIFQQSFRMAEDMAVGCIPLSSLVILCIDFEIALRMEADRTYIRSLGAQN